jgi:long-chain acyl-CoA synthetase
MNIVNYIRDETRLVAQKTAIVEGERAITYQQLLDRAHVLSVALSGRGVRPGQCIAFRCRDGIDYVIGALALLECGAAVVPLADSLTDREITEIIQRIDVAGIVTHGDLPHQSADALGDLFFWQPRAAGAELEQRCRDLGAGFIRFSSGTTGESKGVVLSHRSILDRTDAADRGLAVTDRDVILWVLGMSHHFVVSILLFLRHGATIIVANRNFPFSLLDAAARFPITLIYGSPVHYYLLGASDSIAPRSLAQVRLAISTAMKLPRDVQERFTEKFGIVPAEAYGIIEVGLPFINTDADPASSNSVGRLLPDYQLRIADPDAAGIGEVLLRGKGMFDAYVSPWRLREECLCDGWFDTGDLGRLDEHGRLTLLGRSKTVIICAGMKVFPEEVEQVIDGAPGVIESLVSGRDHPQFGQTPVADVVLAANITDSAAVLAGLRAHCCRLLSSYKVPVEFRQAVSLAKTASGKLRR